MDPSQQTDQDEEGEQQQQPPSVANRLFGFFKNVTSTWAEEPPTNDWDDQQSPLQLPSDEPQQTISSPSSTDNLLQLIQNKIQQILSEYPNLFPSSSEDVLDNLDQFISIIKNLQNQIEELQRYDSFYSIFQTNSFSLIVNPLLMNNQNLLNQDQHLLNNVFLAVYSNAKC